MSESTEIYVRIVVSYETNQHPGVPHVASYQFVDTAPEFPISTGICRSFSDFSNRSIDLWHEDLPKPAAVASSLV